jgi:hypothetical protein
LKTIRVPIDVGTALFCSLAFLFGCGGNAADPAVNVTPPSANVTPGGQQQFFAHVDNAIDPVALFVVQQGGAGGTIDASGLYTAPAAAAAGAQDIIVVSARDNSAPPVQVTVNIQLGVDVSPASVPLSVGRTFQFAADVSGDAQDRVTWSVQTGGAGGTINASGLYTAPATAANGATDTVVATGVVDPTKSDTAAVLLQSAGVPVNVQ